MRYKVYFVVDTDFHIPNPRREFDCMSHTVYQFVEADDSTPIKDIIEAARNKFDKDINPEVATNVFRFQSVFDADFQASVNHKQVLTSIARDRKAASLPAIPQPVFRQEQVIDQGSDVSCLLCLSKAVGVFRCKDSISRPLCSIHRALEMMK